MDTNNLHRLKEIIAVVNNKGGVGKTTTVQSLAAAMVRYRQYWRVLVIDMDPSGDLSKLMGAQPDQMVTPTLTDAMSSSTGRLPIYEHLLQTGGSIYYTPASPELQCIDPALVKQLAPNKVLDRLLHAEPEDLSGHGISSIEDYFDYVLIDCPPDLSMRTMNAMGAADSLLVPVQMEGLPVNAPEPAEGGARAAERQTGTARHTAHDGRCTTEHLARLYGVSAQSLRRASDAHGDTT